MECGFLESRGLVPGVTSMGFLESRILVPGVTNDRYMVIHREGS